MAIRRDKLGRRIPEFDRSAAAKQAQQTNKEKYGPDFHSRNGTTGGRAGKRGYFGTLKDAGNEAELKKLSQEGVKARSKAKGKVAKRDGVSVSGGPS